MTATRWLKFFIVTSDQFDQLLAEIFSSQQTQESLWCSTQSFRNRFAENQFSGGDQLAKLTQTLRP